MSDYLFLVLQSLNWSDIVLGLIVFLLTAASIWAGKRRKAIRKWNKERIERRIVLRGLPAMVATMAANVKTLVENHSRTTLQFISIHEEQKAQSATLGDQNRMLSNIAAMTYGQIELDPLPRFVCNQSGGNEYVNTAYARLIGGGRADLIGFRYQQFMPDSLNPGYMARFALAAVQHVAFEEEITICRTNGSRFKAHVRAVPHPEDVPPATHWNGVVTYLREVK